MQSSSFHSRNLHKKDGKERKKQKKTKRRHTWLSGLRKIKGMRIRRLLLFSIIGGGVLVLCYLAYIWFTLPELSTENLFAVQSTQITDRNGVELYRLHDEVDREWIDLELIPDSIQQSLIAIEDRRFYERGCVDIRALLRVVISAGQAGGGSTITRQLARNALQLSKESIVNRKMKELILGCQLESKYTKDDLLEMYINWIPFGQNAYGIERASQLYFGHTASGLTIAESAVLASLPKAPTYYSPYGSHVRTSVSDRVLDQILIGNIDSISQIPDEEISNGLLGNTLGTGANTLYIGGRTDQVLKDMQDQKLITSNERQEALEELKSMTFQTSRDSIRAPHFVLWIREQVESLLAENADEGILEFGGLTIQTTLDWNLQQIAETVIADKKEDILNQYDANNIALISLDPVTKHILAYVGNADYNDEDNGGKIDMVQRPRQPGSSFKPIVYAGSFKNGYSPATVLYDVETKIGTDTPQDFDLDFLGPLTIRHALAQSRNIPAIKAYFLAGREDTILELAADMGAPTPLNSKVNLQAAGSEFDYGWPLALGSAETPLVEMANVYATFADGGNFAEPISILKITDKDGNILLLNEEEDEREKNEALDERIAYQITSILSDTAARPDAYWQSQLSVPGFQSAAKTGTSNKCLDYAPSGNCRNRKPDNAWVLGYTPNLVTGVWAGNADSSPLAVKGGGLNTASPVWHDYMVRAHNIIEDPVSNFRQPQSLLSVQISTLSGKLPSQCTPVEKRETEIFLQELVPTEQDTACTEIEIDKVTGNLASEECPADAREKGAYFVANSILPDVWQSWEQGVQTWVLNEAQVESGSRLPLPLAPTEVCIYESFREPPEMTIQSPADNGIATYPQFKPQIAFDVASTIREIEFKIDNFVALKTTSEPFVRSIRVPRSIANQGRHTLKITLTDEYYNKVEDEVSFRFGEDEIKPVVILNNPLHQQRFHKGDTVLLQAQALDEESGVQLVQFYLDDTLLSNEPVEPYELAYTLDNEIGRYTIKAVARDFSGNEAEEAVTIEIVPDDIELDREASVREPTILEPDIGDYAYPLNEAIPIRIATPPLDRIDALSLQVEIADSDGEILKELLNIANAKGIYSVDYNPTNIGSFMIRVKTLGTSGERLWQQRAIRVVDQ